MIGDRSDGCEDGAVVHVRVARFEGCNHGNTLGSANGGECLVRYAAALEDYCAALIPNKYPFNETVLEYVPSVVLAP
jgi:hypothetical protein